MRIEPMSITRKFSTAFSLTLAMTACDASEPESNVTQSVRGSDPVLEEAGCPDYRQIATLAVGVEVCPTVEGWAESLLFTGGTGEFARFCKYLWEGAPSQADPTDLQITGLSAVASDCEVVFEQSSLSDEVGDEMETLFHEAIGLADATDLNLPTTEPARSRVSVAVVDSVPEGAPQPRSEHGERMVDLIEDIACPNGAGLGVCEVNVKRSLGLPRYGVGYLDTINGGEYGSQADIAKAIYDAVEAWKAAPAPGHLIINMSFAWEPTLFGDMSDPTPRPSVEAVHTAIEYAVCNEAIVVAAAGNQGYPCTQGPLLPGAWETEAAPDKTRCAELGVLSANSVGYKPLVYSVGGLTHEGEPMAGSRPLGMPRLAAAASHAIAGGDDTTMTGSSISTAVAAGAAALIWSYLPGLSASEVMTIVYASGNPLTLTADYIGPNTTQTTVRAVDVCRAISMACQLTGNCPAMPLGCLTAAPSVTIDALFTEIAALTPDHDESRLWVPEVCTVQECGGFTPDAYLAQALVGTGASACPEPVDQILPLTLPQPTQIGCSHCTLDLTTALVDASLDMDYANATVNDVTIALFDGYRNTYFRFGDATLDESAITQFRLDPMLMPANVESATISITFDPTQPPVVDPLLVRR